MKSVNNKVIPTHLYCDKGFTLAEVLIALVVIGVIAAITMTTVMPNIQERANSQRQANIVYKVTQATNLMKANGAMVDGFSSTDAFVNELQKYLKIMKRCDSEHIADCWPTKTVTDANGDKYEVKNAKKRGDLGFKENSNITNVGIVLNDGASLIMTYDPSAKGLSIGDKLTTFTTDLPAGGKFQTFLDYTSNTTGGLAFVMDVNGGKGPNKETIGTKTYDIRNLNGARFKGCATARIDGTCYTKIASYEPLDCSRESINWKGEGVLNHPENEEYCTTKGMDGNDYWASARKTCADIGARLPTHSELQEICQNHKAELGISSGYYWAEPEQDISNFLASTEVNFNNCEKGYNPRTYAGPVLCVDK